MRKFVKWLIAVSSVVALSGLVMGTVADDLNLGNLVGKIEVSKGRRSQNTVVYLRGVEGNGQLVPTKTLDFGSKNLGRFPLGCCCHRNLAWVVVPSFLLFAQAVRRMDRTHHSGQYRRSKRPAIRRAATNSCMKLNTRALTVWPDGEAPSYFSN